VWRAENDEGGTTTVLVEVSGTAMAVSPEHLPAETAAARATQGLSEVERVLHFDELPRRVALGTTGRVTPPAFEGEPTPEPGWWVLLSGDEPSLRKLSELFSQGAISVCGRDGSFYLRADEFNAHADAGDVRASAIELVRRANGVARLADSAFRPVEVDRVELVSEGGGRQHFVALGVAVESSAALSMTVIRGDGTREEVVADPDAVPASDLLAVAANEPDVARALRLIGQAETTWPGLYHLYEVVLGDVGGLIYDDGWASRIEVERFRRTANSPAVLGEHARHGRETTEPPSNPMSLREARDLVERLVRRWLAEKGSLGS
jgi:hypothetical protein